MTWNELETALRERAKEQPRGFQARLARQLGIKPSTVAQAVAGHKAIPAEWLGPMTELMGVQVKLVPSAAT